MITGSAAADDAPRSFCVYTTLIGGYEVLNEQRVAGASRVPFICLTDDVRLRSETWQVRVVPTLFPMDPVRSQRALKLRPHEALPEFDASLYIDNSVILEEPPEALIEQLLPVPGFCLAEHSFRGTVIDEFLEVARDALDDQSRILEQLYHYAIDCPGVLREKPYWTGLMLRHHRSPSVRNVLDLWSAHVQRYSRRDQLSVNFAFRRAGWSPQLLPIDNHASRFHSWPTRVSRNQARFAPLPPASFGVSDPVIRDLERRLESTEQSLAEERRLRSSLLSSSTWRATAPLRALGDRLPGFGRSVRAVATAILGRPAADDAGAPGSPIRGPSTEAGGHATEIARAGLPAGRSLHVAPGDERGRQLLLHGGDLNPPTLAMWRQLLAAKPWTHILDVGANYGEMLLNVELPASARVLAFEPNPHVLIPLIRNLLDARIRVEVVPEGVSDRKGSARLLVDRAWSGTTRLDESCESGEAGEAGAPESLTVPTTTLADELRAAAAASRVRALVKVDVEGHEIPVLRGIGEILDGLEDFAALVEILHLPPDDRAWLLEHFEVELFHLASSSLVRVNPGTPDRLAKLLAEGTFYAQDVVLRRNSAAGLVAPALP